MRQNITVEICSVRAWDNRDWPGDSLAGAIAWLQAKLDSIPEPDRASATIEFGADEGVPTIDITYRHRETDQEMEAREAPLRRARANQLIAEEAHEREMLRRLKAKYEGPGS